VPLPPHYHVIGCRHRRLLVGVTLNSLRVIDGIGVIDINAALSLSMFGHYSHKNATLAISYAGHRYREYVVGENTSVWVWLALPRQ